MSSRLQWATLAGCLTLSVTALAQEQEGDEPAPPPEAGTPPPTPAETTTGFGFEVGPLPIEIHGYASQGFVISDHNNYYASESGKGSLRLTEVALNATSQVTERTRIVLQVASVINDDETKPGLRLDFGFVDYRFADAFGLRFGRYRVLSTLYSEVWDTDIARLPIFMPASVYDPQGRQFFLSSQGAQAYGSVRSREAGSLDYAVSVGALAPFSLGGGDIKVDFVSSARLIYNTPIDGLRIGTSGIYANGSSVTDLGAIATIGLIQAGLAPPTFDGRLGTSLSDLWRVAAFAELSLGGFTLAAEYLRMGFDLAAKDPAFAALIPPANANNEDFYVLASYRFTDHFTAGGYASFHFEDYKQRDAKDPAMHSFDYAATLRFDLNAYLAFKAELHRIYGTARLIADLNPGAKSDEGWLLALRATAAF